MVPERTSLSSSRTPPQSEYAKTSTSKNESDKLVVMDDTQGDTSEATDDGGILDCRQNFAAEVETAINAQINRELDASYRYFAMVNISFVLFDEGVVQIKAVKLFYILLQNF